MNEWITEFVKAFIWAFAAVESGKNGKYSRHEAAAFLGGRIVRSGRPEHKADGRFAFTDSSWDARGETFWATQDHFVILFAGSADTLASYFVWGERGKDWGYRYDDQRIWAAYREVTFSGWSYGIDYLCSDGRWGRQGVTHLQSPTTRHAAERELRRLIELTK